ncbi:MAG: zinc ribbon domain-containing protein [Actinomycetales bacterium]|nr:zinc ribbon domain-containing protein [Actinomycetales bacterium]
MFCTSCGASQADGATFCFSCGSALGQAPAAAPAASNPAPAAHPTTTHVHASELPPRAPLYPQLVRGDVTKVRDTLAWVIAGLPFVNLLAFVTDSSLGYFLGIGALVGFAVFVVNLFMVISDQQQMRREGFAVAYAWGILLPFVYLVIRGVKLRRANWLGAVWFAGWVLGLLAPWFASRLNGGYFY